MDTIDDINIVNFERGMDPKKAMGTGLLLPPKEKDKVPFYERREVWRSPLAIPVGLCVAIFFIGWGIWWLIKWPILSVIRPFTNSKKLCKLGFHKYREQADHKWHETKYKCYVCEEVKVVSDND